MLVERNYSAVYELSEKNKIKRHNLFIQQLLRARLTVDVATKAKNRIFNARAVPILLSGFLLIHKS